MPENWPWNRPRERSQEEIRDEARRQRRHLSRLLKERVDELERRRDHDKMNDLRRQAGLGELPFYPSPRYSLITDSERYPDQTYHDLLLTSKTTDSRMDERNMAFPVYNSQHERSLLEALSVTSVSLQYDTTTPAPDLSPNSFDYRDDAATFTGVAITVAGTLTDKQARLLTKWAQDRFGPTYERSQPRLSVAPVTPAPTVVPVTFTERTAK